MSKIPEIKISLNYYFKGTIYKKEFGIYTRSRFEIIRNCCPDFKRACKQDYFKPHDDIYTQSFFGFGIKKAMSYPEGDYDEDYMNIHFCPFCGEEIYIKLEEIHQLFTEKIAKHQHRKSPFSKGLNRILLNIKIHALIDKKEDGFFLYKYGLNKIFWKE